MATYSNILEWKSPWTEEAGGLQTMGLQRVEQDWVTEHARLGEDAVVYFNYTVLQGGDLSSQDKYKGQKQETKYYAS